VGWTRPRWRRSWIGWRGIWRGRNAEVASLREQNERIKAALRDWQSRQAPKAYELARR